ncbi:hypothetical protein HDV00_008512 [Rhizophlyctis rosea]|nr:hypothetical protein HDV00_008512 [Rhizophlyctis rosea]
MSKTIISPAIPLNNTDKTQAPLVNKHFLQTNPSQQSTMKVTSAITSLTACISAVVAAPASANSSSASLLPEAYAIALKHANPVFLQVAFLDRNNDGRVTKEEAQPIFDIFKGDSKLAPSAKAVVDFFSEPKEGRPITDFITALTAKPAASENTLERRQINPYCNPGCLSCCNPPAGPCDGAFDACIIGVLLLPITNGGSTGIAGPACAAVSTCGEKYW